MDKSGSGIGFLKDLKQSKEIKGKRVSQLEIRDKKESLGEIANTENNLVDLNDLNDLVDINLVNENNENNDIENKDEYSHNIDIIDNTDENMENMENMEVIDENIEDEILEEENNNNYNITNMRNKTFSINVFIKDKKYKIFCGEGKQKIRWLSDAAIFKYELLGIGLCGSAYSMKLENGNTCSLDARICDVLINNENVWVLNKEEYTVQLEKMKEEVRTRPLDRKSIKSLRKSKLEAMPNMMMNF